MRFGLLILTLASVTQAQQRLPEPTPEPAVPAILAAFSKYPIVTMSHGHGYKDLDDFILTLVRHPAFPDVVNDIVVECTNSRYQSQLDRYIAGEDIAFDSVSQAWRNTQPGCADTHTSLFPLIRGINRRLAPAKRIRVLAGEPASDWNTPKTTAEVRHLLALEVRDSSAARIIEREVLGKQRKALVLYGSGHMLRALKHSMPNIYERQHPGVTFVVGVHTYCAGDGLAEYQELERRTAKWPVPSVALTKNTSLTEIDALQTLTLFGAWSQSNDALLYLGPGELQLRQPTPGYVWTDSAYFAQLRTRYAIPGSASTRAKNVINPGVARAMEENPFMCGRIVPKD